MILSPEIERAALNGDCIWRTFNTGYTEDYTIPVPNGSFIILRQIIAYPFIQPQKDRVLPTNSSYLWQLCAAEEGSNNELVYVIRNRYLNNDAGNEIPGEPITIETFATFKKNVIVNVGMAPAVNGATYTVGALIDNSANERINGAGYAGVFITPDVTLDGSQKLYPTGQDRLFPVPYAGNVTDRIRYTYSSLSTITPPAGSEREAAFQVPLLTFGYWEFKAGYSVKF